MSLKKSNLSKTYMDQSVESNFFKKFKAIASLPIPRPYFRFFFFLKKQKNKKQQQQKDFLENLVNLAGHGNLVLIT